MTDEPTGERDEAAAPGRHPSPAAAAASRARRIGGRGVVKESAPTPEPAEPATAVALDKGSRKQAEDHADREPPSPRVAVAAPPWLRWLPAGVLSAGAIAMAVLLVVLSHGVWWATPSAQATRDRVLASAKTCMVAINTYKYTDLDTYEHKALACTTGTLTSDLRKAIDQIVKVRAPQLKASQTIQVSNAGIEHASGGHWTVLIFAQVTLKSTTYPKGSQTPYAAEVQMAKAHGTWLLSRETTLGGSGATGGGAVTPNPSPSTSPSTGPSPSGPSPSGSGSPTATRS